MQLHSTRFYSLILATLIYAPCAQTKPTSESEFVGMYVQSSVDVQSHAFILEDNTFCLTVMGGSLNLIKAGRWKATTNTGTINLKEIRENEPIHLALGRKLDRLGATMVGINFDGYTLSRAYSPVFAVSSSDTPPTTLRPLFPSSSSSWAQTYALPLMAPEKARYFFIGDVGMDRQGRPQKKLRVTQYKIDDYDTIRIGFNDVQTEPPLDLDAEMDNDVLLINGEEFGSKQSLSKEMITKVREQCINPVLNNGNNTSSNNKQKNLPRNSKILTPIKSFDLSTTAIAGEPIFKTKDEKNTTETDSIEALIESEDNQLQTAFKRASEDSKTLDDFLLLTKDLASKKTRIKIHAPAITGLFSKLIVTSNSSGDFTTSKKTFLYFIDNIYPAIKEIKNKAMLFNISNIASQGLVISTSLKDAKIGQIIFDTLLGSDFDIKTQKNDVLIYNLACFYAVNNNKKEMIAATVEARKHKKPAKLFMNDPDFKNYLNDADFLKALE